MSLWEIIKTMKTLIVSALALTAMASAALADAPTVTTTATPAPAGPMQLTEAQLGQATAGYNFFIPIVGAQGVICQYCRGGGDAIRLNLFLGPVVETGG